ncbi:MAG: DUF1573 domain-containing protein [Chitinophagales bacterium]
MRIFILFMLFSLFKLSFSQLHCSLDTIDFGILSPSDKPIKPIRACITNTSSKTIKLSDLSISDDYSIKVKNVYYTGSYFSKKFYTIDILPNDTFPIVIFLNKKKDFYDDYPIEEEAIFYNDSFDNVLRIPIKYTFKSGIVWQSKSFVSDKNNAGDIVHGKYYLTNFSNDTFKLIIDSYIKPTEHKIILPFITDSIIFSIDTDTIFEKYNGRIYVEVSKKKTRLYTSYLDFSFDMQNIKSYARITFDSTVITRNYNQGDNTENMLFYYTNTGNIPLIINECHTSSGCIVATYQREPILPNQKGIIKVHYDTNRVGRYSKSITINSNDIRNMPIVLQVNGEVYK